MTRPRPIWRCIALLVAVLLTSSTSRWPNAVPRACAGCPPDCPMHAKKLKCHEATGMTCHKQRVPGQRLGAPGCRHGEAPVDHVMPVELSAPSRPYVPTPDLPLLASAPRAPLPVWLDTPFRPPRRSLS